MIFVIYSYLALYNIEKCFLFSAIIKEHIMTQPRKSLDGKDKSNKTQQDTSTSLIPDLVRATAPDQRPLSEQREISDRSEPQQKRLEKNLGRNTRIDSNNHRPKTRDFSEEFTMLLQRHQYKYNRISFVRPLESRRNSARRRERALGSTLGDIWKRTPTNPLRRRGTTENRNIVAETYNQIALERGLTLLKRPHQGKLDHILPRPNARNSARRRRERPLGSMRNDVSRREERPLSSLKRQESGHPSILIETYNQIALERGRPDLKQPNPGKLDHALPRGPIRERVYMANSDSDSDSDNDNDSNIEHCQDNDRVADTVALEVAWVVHRTDMLTVPINAIDRYISDNSRENVIKQINDIEPNKSERERRIKKFEKIRDHTERIVSVLKNIRNNVRFLPDPRYRLTAFNAIKADLRTIAIHLHKLKKYTTGSEPQYIAAWMENIYQEMKRYN